MFMSDNSLNNVEMIVFVTLLRKRVCLRRIR